MKIDQKVINQIKQEFDSYIKDVTKVEDSESPELLKTGIRPFDTLLGGGIGRFSLVTGNPGTMKSTICANIASQFQKDHTDGLVVYVDSEHSMSPNRLQQLGLKGIVPKTNLTIEQVFNLINAIVMFKEEKKVPKIPVLFIWDSIANTPSQAELTASEPKEVVGMKARIISLLLPKTMNLLEKYNIYILAVNQLRDRIVIGYDTGADLKHMGAGSDMPGGKALKFAATQLLQNKVSQSFDADTSPYGQRATIVKFKTVKNKYAPDNFSLDLLSLASTGFDDVLSTFLLLRDAKEISMSAWSYLKNYPQKKFRIKEIKDVYFTDPLFKGAFDEAASAVLNKLEQKMANYEEWIPSDKVEEPEEETEEEIKISAEQSLSVVSV